MGNIKVSLLCKVEKCNWEGQELCKKCFGFEWLGLSKAGTATRDNNTDWSELSTSFRTQLSLSNYINC